MNTEQVTKMYSEILKLTEGQEVEDITAAITAAWSTILVMENNKAKQETSNLMALLKQPREGDSH